MEAHQKDALWFRASHPPPPGHIQCTDQPTTLPVFSPTPCRTTDQLQLPEPQGSPTSLPRHHELHLQNNQLSTVPPGHFDRLQGLRRVTLHGNPFHCNCEIQYLSTWLKRNGAVVSGGVPTCASPSSVAHTAITVLSVAYFSSCAQQRCAREVYDTLVGVMLCGLIGLLLWGLRLAKNSTFTLDMDQRHAWFEADSLKSLKPKHRRTLQRLSV